MTAPKDKIFKPGKMSSDDKASARYNLARQINAAEAAERARKTERLRQLRLQRDAGAEPAPVGKVKISSR